MHSGTPHMAEATPLYEAIGFYTPKRGPSVYYLRIRGHVRGFRTSDISNAGFLLEILPDLEHWRSAFPARYHNGIDTGAVCAHFMALCYAVGPCDREGMAIPEAFKASA